MKVKPDSALQGPSRYCGIQPGHGAALGQDLDDSIVASAWIVQTITCYLGLSGRLKQES